MPSLSTSQRKYLKQQAHHLAPLVQVGRAGASAEVVHSLEQALAAHELVKIKFVARKNEKKSICTQLAEQCGAELVTVIGHVAVFFRQNDEANQPSLALPKSG